MTHFTSFVFGSGLLFLSANVLAQEAVTPVQETPVVQEAPVVQSNASPGWNFHFVGSAWSRYELRDNYTFMGGSTPNNGEDFFIYNVRPGIESEPFRLRGNRSITVRIVPQGTAIRHAGVTGNDGNVSLHEGYSLLDFGISTLQTGRFEMYYGEGRLVGPSFWHVTGRAFDGARFSYNPGFQLDVFATQTTEISTYLRGGGTSEIGGGDQWFNGIYAQLGPIVSENLDLDLYVYQRYWMRDHRGPMIDDNDTPDDLNDDIITTTPNRDDLNEFTLGARVAGEASSLDYEVELMYQMGSRNTADEVAAYSADLVLGYTLPSSMRLGFTGFMVSGNDPDTDADESFNRLFGQSHKFFGLMDYVGHRNNLAGGSFFLRHKIAEQWVVTADVFYFMRPHLVVDGEDGMNALGEELDLSLKYIFGVKTALRGGASVFLPASNDIAEDPAYFFELMMVTRF